MFNVHEEDIKLNKLKGREYKLLASEDLIGCRNLCAGVSFFPPMKHAPGHIHEIEEEVIYCIEGKGEVFIDGKSIQIEPGSVVYFPPKSLHSVNNTGKDTIKLFFVFSPSVKIGAYKNHENR